MVVESPTHYRVFTRWFDKIVSVVSVPAKPATERSWKRFMEGTLENRTIWEIQGSRQADRLRSSLSGQVLNDTIVTFLVDQSGSMRGERMLMAAAAVDVARAFLVHLGVSVEILGFTTRSWKGGWSRTLWRWTGRRRHPGRLCDLLHIIYAEASDHRRGTGVRSLVHMLDPSRLKENVDGEALLWAAERQDKQARLHKVIVVVSDGVPADDSTLNENGLTYLTDHLREVIARLKMSRKLAQLQMGDDAETWFERSLKVHTISNVGSALLNLVSDTLTSAVVTRDAANKL